MVTILKSFFDCGFMGMERRKYFEEEHFFWQAMLGDKFSIAWNGENYYSPVLPPVYHYNSPLVLCISK